MASPYITPEILINAPTGISWETIPDFNSSPDAQLAEQVNICWRASHWIDAYCNQPLRATEDSEEFMSPNYRITVDNYGLARALTSRWPVTQIISGQVSSSRVAPAQWQDIPINAMYVENELTLSAGISIEAATGPSSICITPGYVGWWSGRRGQRVKITYINGWSHAGITAPSTLGSTQVTVDDTTGMYDQNALRGRGMWIYDGARTENVRVASVSTSTGPGVVTRTSPLLYDHNGSTQQPVLMSALPADVQQAAIMHATWQALARGATATTVQTMPGATSSGGNAQQNIMADIKELLLPFRRIL